MAYIVGFFAADGYLTSNKRGAQFWSIQITDRYILEKIRKYIQSEHKLGVRNSLKGYATIYRLQIGSKEMCADLNKLGFVPRKTKNLAVPSVPDKFFSDFVRGYFDGDGNVWVGDLNKHRKNPVRAIQTSFTSCSGSFLYSFLERLRLAGISGGSVHESKQNYSRLNLSIRDSLKLYEFMYNQPYLEETGLFLKRKRQVFERYMKEINRGS